MLVLSLSVLLLSALTASSVANEIASYDVSGQLHPRPKDPVSIVVNGGFMTGHVRKNGEFTIHGLAPGVYALEFFSTRAVYSTIKVNVLNDGEVLAMEYRFPGDKKRPTKYPLRVRQQASPKYFEPRKEISIMQILQNRSVLFAGVMLLLVVGMPLLMNNMGEDERAVMEAQQAAMMGDGSNPMAGIMNMMGVKAPAGGLAGALGGVGGADSDDEDEVPKRGGGSAAVGGTQQGSIAGGSGSGSASGKSGRHGKSGRRGRGN